jgi:hypothetical protein
MRTWLGIGLVLAGACGRSSRQTQPGPADAAPHSDAVVGARASGAGPSGPTAAAAVPAAAGDAAATGHTDVAASETAAKPGTAVGSATAAARGTASGSAATVAPGGAAAGAGVAARPPVDAGVLPALDAAPRQPRTVLSWGGAGGFGSSEWFAIDASGAATYETVSTRGVSARKTGRVTKAKLASVTAILRAHALCSLRADPQYMPVPEEHHTTLAVDLAPDLACSVTLHTNEWNRSSDAKAIDDAIRKLRLSTALR